MAQDPLRLALWCSWLYIVELREIIYLSSLTVYRQMHYKAGCGGSMKQNGSYWQGTKYYNNAKGQIVHLENDITLGANKSVQTIIIITTGTIIYLEP